EFVSSNSYEGIPNPNEADLQKIIKNLGLEKVMRDYYYRQMVGQPESVKLADEPEYTWHTINSVEFNIVAVYTREKTGRIRHTMRIRLYRDDVKADWKNVISSSKKEEIL
ncbi:MAG: hypothetical protein WBO10_12370, partial [Pyrinomonadaceae bacterium]